MVLTLWQQHTQIPDLLAMTTALRKPTDPGWQNHRKLRQMLVLLPQTQCELECLRGREGDQNGTKPLPLRVHTPQLCPQRVSGGNASHCEMTQGAEGSPGSDVTIRAQQRVCSRVQTLHFMKMKCFT